MNNDINSILNYLKKNRGFDFTGYHDTMVERRVNQRLSDIKCKNYKEYLRLIQKQPDELDHLIDLLTINVSRFFRNTLTFEYIADRIFPVVFSKKDKGDSNSIRVWSAGCSYGEEPYSIAILINEFIKKENLKLNVNIFATDIDKAAIKKAEQAAYTYESIKSVKYRLIKKYFIMKDKSYRLNPEIKNLVNFSLYDILDKKSYAPPESIFGDFDMVLCRNLLIYFKTEHQLIIFDKLYRSLKKGGYLVLGEAEIPIMKYQRSFKKVNECCNIYQKK